MGKKCQVEMGMGMVWLNSLISPVGFAAFQPPALFPKGIPTFCTRLTPIIDWHGLDLLHFSLGTQIPIQAGVWEWESSVRESFRVF